MYTYFYDTFAKTCKYRAFKNNVKRAWKPFTDSWAFFLFWSSRGHENVSIVSMQSKQRTFSNFHVCKEKKNRKWNLNTRTKLTLSTAFGWIWWAEVCRVQMKVQKWIIGCDFRGSTSLHKNKRSSACAIHLSRRGGARNKMKAECGWLPGPELHTAVDSQQPICLDLVHFVSVASETVCLGSAPVFHEAALSHVHHKFLTLSEFPSTRSVMKQRFCPIMFWLRRVVKFDEICLRTLENRGDSLNRTVLICIYLCIINVVGTE